VSATAALIKQEYPELTPGQIANRLVKTAGLPPAAKGTKVPDKHYGYGYIQPLAAVTKDIPTGSKYGPLKVPASSAGSDSTQGNAAPDSSASSDSSSGTSHLLLFGGVGVVILVAIVMALVFGVRAARR
jgi:subtilisin family serine protease